MPADPRTTPMGTPWAATWDAPWADAVADRETQLGRRICGCRTRGGMPCPQVSTHPSGRCRHHGGFDLTGAPAGNRNAQVHGLYARRVMLCGSHCPAWQTCPLGGAAPDEGASIVKLKGADRPACPYEEAEYQAAVTDARRVAKAQDPKDDWGEHLAHQVALLTVMVSRAARAMSHRPLVDRMEQSGENYHMAVDKPAASLVAFDKLSRELRRWVALLDRRYPPSWVHKKTERETDERHEAERHFGTPNVPHQPAEPNASPDNLPGRASAIGRTSAIGRASVPASRRTGRTSLLGRASVPASRRFPASVLSFGSTFSLRKEKVDGRAAVPGGRAERKRSAVRHEGRNPRNNIQPHRTSLLGRASVLASRNPRTSSSPHNAPTTSACHPGESRDLRAPKIASRQGRRLRIPVKSGHPRAGPHLPDNATAS